MLVLAAPGRSNADIADLLVIAESTAKTHVKRVLSKIDVHDRAQAVVFAYHSGLITNGRPWYRRDRCRDTSMSGQPGRAPNRSDFDDLDKLIQPGEVSAVSRDKRQVLASAIDAMKRSARRRRGWRPWARAGRCVEHAFAKHTTAMAVASTASGSWGNSPNRRNCRMGIWPDASGCVCSVASSTCLAWRF